MLKKMISSQIEFFSKIKKVLQSFVYLLVMGKSINFASIQK